MCLVSCGMILLQNLSFLTPLSMQLHLPRACPGLCCAVNGKDPQFGELPHGVKGPASLQTRARGVEGAARSSARRQPGTDHPARPRWQQLPATLSGQPLERKAAPPALPFPPCL